MKKISFIIFLLTLTTSCSKDYLFNNHQTKVSQELKKIKNSDQAVRFYPQMVNLKYNIRDFYSVSDSIYNADVKLGKKSKPFDFSKIPSEKIQVSKFPKQIQDDYYDEYESGQKLMVYVDSINRKGMYDIIKKYGYPSFYNRKWKDTINVRIGVTAILTHTDYNTAFGKKLLKLMLREYFVGRIEEGEMKQFLWHVDGRKGYPYDYVIDKERWSKRLRE
ncbi:MAG: hypothetical protein ABIQ27_01020 [Flavobacterium sp.]|uniref:hypothetical protein n=1 Tax=Flavobacterium sp. TaxID=239 RepID=UPI0032651538